MPRLLFIFINIIISTRLLDEKDIDIITKHLNYMENNFVSNFNIKIEGEKD